MSFKDKKYTIKRNAISKDMARFLYDYLLLKRKTARTMFDVKFLSPYTEYFGVWNDPQALGTFSLYGDTTFDTILEGLKYKIEKSVGHNLCPTYSYARLYKKGDKKWPIYYKPTNKKTIKVTLSSGDLLLYYGKNEHWREPFNGEICGQVFLHYNDGRDKKALKNIYDGRQYPGLPSWFKKD